MMRVVARRAAKRSTSIAPTAYRLQWHPAASAVRVERDRAVGDSVVAAVAVAADRVAVVAVAGRSKPYQRGCVLSAALFLRCVTGSR